MRKTKIICTLGPSTDDPQILREMIHAGMDVARFNFSHGSHEEHKARLAQLKKLRKELYRPVAALLDTKGPEIRLKEFAGGAAVLERGQLFTLYGGPHEGNAQGCSISFGDLWKDVTPGCRILLDDGLIELVVDQIREPDIICRVQNGGPISDHKGINVPNVSISMPYLSDRDRDDIRFGVENGFDFIAASFTRCADDILQIRALLKELGCDTINIIAKIENREGVENIDEIVAVSDGIMVARGDMGVEIDLEQIPVIQKKLIKKIYNSDRPVITATQMLESMIQHPRPTRAEATDVANAIYDGTSAIMLSGETAVGKYPVDAVRTMCRIAEAAEADIDYVKRFKTRSDGQLPDVTNAISHATCTTAIDLGATAIITVTKSGHTARMISKYRPSMPIIGCCPTSSGARRLNLSWGVVPTLVEMTDDSDQLFEMAVKSAEEAGIVHTGDVVVLTAGLPLGISGTTNLLKVEVVGNLLVSGNGLIPKKVCGRLCVCKNETEALEAFEDGDILVIPYTSNRILPLLKRASGLVVEQGGPDSHAATVCLALEIPAVLGAIGATQILKHGSVVQLDSGRGVVSSASKN